MASTSPRRRRLHLAATIFGMGAIFALRVWASLSVVRVAGSSTLAPRSRQLTELQSAAVLLDLHEDDRQCGSISKISPRQRCEHARRYCKGSRSLLNYAALHYCILHQKSWISLPVLASAIAFFFLWLAHTADSFFSPVAGLMVEMLRMSPTMGGVTLLALGNGAPDVFASMAAIGGGNSRIGLGAIISAGTFVSAFVVGSVALVAAPFSVKPVPFVRDVLFYTIAVAALFLLYLKGAVTLRQATGMMLFYALFIAVVLFMDQLKKSDAESHLNQDQQQQAQQQQNKFPESIVEESYVEVEQGHLVDHGGEGLRISLKQLFLPCRELCAAKRFKIKSLIQAPLDIILRATIPEANPCQWNRLYATANIVFCPLLVLFMFRSFIPLDYPVTFLLPTVQLPLWSLILFQNSFLAVAFYLVAKQPPEATQLVVAFSAFAMSVFWISFIAGELLGCLAAVGVVSGISPALLGLTVLAWGNSMGDLVADVAIARAGKPDMAIAGCFAGPMFNMLVGLGSALVMHTSYLSPPEYYLPYHSSIIIAFGFLFTSLLGSLVVVSFSNFRVTRAWGFCLICLYFIFTIVSLLAATGLL